MSIQLGEAKRRYERHFVSKLTDADAEQMETQHWIDEACDCKYLDTKQAVESCLTWTCLSAEFQVPAHIVRFSSC
jgi:four helix bundle protein